MPSPTRAANTKSRACRREITPWPSFRKSSEKRTRRSRSHPKIRKRSIRSSNQPPTKFENKRGCPTLSRFLRQGGDFDFRKRVSHSNRALRGLSGNFRSSSFDKLLTRNTACTFHGFKSHSRNNLQSAPSQIRGRSRLLDISSHHRWSASHQQRRRPVRSRLPNFVRLLVQNFEARGWSEV